nr:GNAT family N-acetyltransferase [uncultured Flavobacterium sp.]
MEIKHNDNGKRGTFRAFEGEAEAGIITYVWQDEKTFIIEHTVGNPDFKGVGMVLLNAAVEYARQNDFKIVPVCAFAKKMFERKPELADVLAAS